MNRWQQAEKVGITHRQEGAGGMAIVKRMIEVLSEIEFFGIIFYN